MNGQAGKGDRYRPVDRAKYEASYERIFGHSGPKKKKGKKNGR